MQLEDDYNAPLSPSLSSECGSAAAEQRDPAGSREAAHAVQGVGARRRLPRRHPQRAQGPPGRLRVHAGQRGEQEYVRQSWPHGPAENETVCFTKIHKGILLGTQIRILEPSIRSIWRVKLYLIVIHLLTLVMIKLSSSGYDRIYEQGVIKRTQGLSIIP